MNRISALRSIPAALLLVLATPSASAAQDDVGFELHLDPLVIEGLYLDQDTESSKFEEYRDLSDGFRIPLLNLSGRSDDARRELRFQVVDGARDDAFYGLRYDVAGSWRLELSYDNIPHRFGNNGRILWTRTAPGSWEIQDPVQGALQGAIEEQFAVNSRGINFDFLDGLIQPYLAVAAETDIGLQRRRTRAALEIGRWNLEYRHESRTGLRAYGTSFGFNNVTELPEPIDYDTRDATLSGTWRWDGGLLTAGYRYSTFENAISTLTFDNPWRLTDATDSGAYLAPGAGSIGGASRGFVDLAPDNDAASLFANGRFDFGDAGWIQAALSWSRFEQDDRLLPFTLNSAIVTPPQPFERANRKAESKRLSLDYGRRFGDGWQAGARYVYNDYADDSPRYEFPAYVRFHAVLEEIPRVTVGYDWTRQTISAHLDKDLGDYGDLTLEVRRDSYDRDFRETEETTEDVVALKWGGRVGRALVRASYETGSRDHDGSYRTDAQHATFLDPEEINNLPGLRKFTQANRDLDRWRLTASLPFAEVWSTDLHVAGLDSEYDDSEFGLTGDQTIRYGFDLSRAMADGSALVFFYERSDRDVSQAARQSGATPSTNPLDDWFADFEEINDNWGVSWRKETAAWKLSLTADYIESDGGVDLFSPPGGSPDTATGFENYEDYDRLTLSGGFDFELSADVAIGVSVLYEDYSIDSFIRQDLANYLPGALLIFADDGEYSAWSSGVRMSFRF